MHRLPLPRTYKPGIILIVVLFVCSAGGFVMRRSTLLRVLLCITVAFAPLGFILNGEMLALVGTNLGQYVTISAGVSLVILLARARDHRDMEIFRKWRLRELAIWSGPNWPRIRPI